MEEATPQFVSYKDWMDKKVNADAARATKEVEDRIREITAEDIRKSREDLIRLEFNDLTIPNDKEVILSKVNKNLDEINTLISDIRNLMERL